MARWPNGSDGTKTVTVSMTGTRPIQETVEVVPENELRDANKKINKFCEYILEGYTYSHCIRGEFDNLSLLENRLINVELKEHNTIVVGDLVLCWQPGLLFFGEVFSRHGWRAEIAIDKQTITKYRL